MFSSIHKEGFERDLTAVYHSKFPELFLAVEIPSRVFSMQRFSDIVYNLVDHKQFASLSEDDFIHV